MRCDACEGERIFSICTLDISTEKIWNDDCTGLGYTLHIPWVLISRRSTATTSRVLVSNAGRQYNTDNHPANASLL